MIYIPVSHKIKDYNKWKEIFDSNDGLRSEYGLESTKILRSVYEPGDIHVLVSFHSLIFYN